jgi:glycerol-3-phosphate acyltransferase PlsY
VLLALFIIGAYLLGSIPVGLILARFGGKDPRKVGSGNIGATNVMRAAGKKAGIITLLGDMAKGFIPTLLALHWLGEPSSVALVGFAAFVGHLFPLYLGFKGGKGVATSVGLFLAISPLAILIATIIFVLLLVKWGYVSLGSLVGTIAMPVTLVLLGAPASYTLLSLAVAVLVFIKHRENIRRLLAGTESRISLSKKTIKDRDS